MAVSEGTFPYNENPPSRRGKRRHLLRVALLISFELRAPERRPRLRLCRESAAGMSVPEAPVAENHSPMTLQNDIGAAGKNAAVKSETQACAVETGSNDLLGSRVHAPNAGHVAAAFRWRKSIHHVARTRG